MDDKKPSLFEVLTESEPDGGDSAQRPCMNRRAFLLKGGMGVGAAMIAVHSFPLNIFGSDKKVTAVKATYERRKISTLSGLKSGVPVVFNYPYENVSNVLIKIGALAGGGVGPEMDVVAFNQQCTHMGGPLSGTYKEKFQVLGPCPLHLTTFDLTRHGMVVSGHGTESLPQIVLETEGDDIYAVGVMGLVFGFSDMQRAGVNS